MADAPPTETRTLEVLLARPIDQRVREFKYRFAQAAIFGLPVIALQLFGDRLSNAAETQRWIAVFGSVLAGWITFIAAGGMVFEGIVLLLLRRRVTMDFTVALFAIGMYVASLISAAFILVRGAPLFKPPLFHVVAIVLVGWCGWRWRSLAATASGNVGQDL